ncbi:hypothetical protein ACGFNP_19225 [Nonomuraea sp. NPDC049269]|uniref:hypothetical protein n=1 Tax=Nonomuraea sp. NPDC049269 TaxID=3364349 RepID=UPI003723A078
MDVSNITRKSTVRNPVRRLVAGLLEVLDAWAFAELDARARERGWQVRRPAPLMRVYRAPEFDTYVRCAACEGEGVTRRGLCRACLGLGRVRR